jgi:hypothetical protein
VSDRLVRFHGTSWEEIEALPQPLRWTVQRTIFHLLDEPVPTLADPFPGDDPLPGAGLKAVHRVVPFDVGVMDCVVVAVILTSGARAFRAESKSWLLHASACARAMATAGASG